MLVQHRGVSFRDQDAELYDPATGKWSLTGNLSGPALVMLRRYFKMARFSWREGAWTGMRSLPWAAPNYTTQTLRPGASPAASTRRAQSHPNDAAKRQRPVARRRDSSPFFQPNTAELYDPATGQWSSDREPTQQRTGATVTLLPNGQVLVVGGWSMGLSLERSSQQCGVVRPGYGKWNATASLNTARSGHSATLLTNGTVLVVGGVDDSVIWQRRVVFRYQSERELCRCSTRQRFFPLY